MIKSEIKEDLTKVLVTREIFEERFQGLKDLMNERFESMNSKFESMDARFESINIHFQSMKEYIDERFKRMELWFKVLVGLSLFGITLANPGFIEIVKSLSR